MELNFEYSGQSEEKHECRSRREGDWVIYTCPHHDCDYERRFNVRTGEMEFHGISTEILHHGRSAPVGIDPVSINLN